MSDNEITRDGKPVLVRMTPAVITLLFLILGSALTGAVFVVRLNDSIDTALDNQRHFRLEMDTLQRQQLFMNWRMQQWDRDNDGVIDMEPPRDHTDKKRDP